MASTSDSEVIRLLFAGRATVGNKVRMVRTVGVVDTVG